MFSLDIDQGWSTLFGLHATLETILVCSGQYKYLTDLFDLAFDRKNRLSTVHFLKKQHFISFISLKKCSQATLRCLAGRMWPARRTLSRTDIDSSYVYK